MRDTNKDRAATLALLLTNLIFGFSFMASRIALIPVVTAVLSGPMLHEKLPAKAYGWILCSVAGVALISSILAFMLQNYALTYIDAARVAVFSNIVPVVSVLAGVLLLGEPFSALFMLGIILIILGVYKVNAIAADE